MPLTPSLSRIGPITRAVEDAALVMAAINHHDPHTPGSIDIGFAYQGDLDLSKLKVGYEPQWFETVGFSAETAIPASEAHRNVLRVLKDLGVELVEIKMPKLPIVALLPILSAEAAMVFEDLTLSNRDDELVTQDLVLSWPNAWREIRLMSAIDYLQADRVRRLLMESMDRVFAEVDILCGPLHGESIALMTATNMTGHPGLTTRVGFADLPTRTLAGTYSNPNGARHRVTQNIALHGRLFEEGTLLALARALEERLDVWRERPPVG